MGVAVSSAFFLGTLTGPQGVLGVQDPQKNPQPSGSPRKGGPVGSWQAPEIEAWRQVFVLIQSMELIDGFAVVYMPVQVTVPVNGDADHPALQGNRCLKPRLQDQEIPVLCWCQQSLEVGSIFFV